MESEATDLLRVELGEDLFERVVVALHADIELPDPVYKYHTLVSLLLLHSFGALDDSLLELLEANGKIAALIRLNFSKACDLILCQASL